MKRVFLSFIIFALIIVVSAQLCACRQSALSSSVEYSVQNKSTATSLTPAQEYLNKTPRDDVLNYFQWSSLIRTGGSMGFTNVSDISTDELFRFAVLAYDSVETQWYNDKDMEFHIPVSDIKSILDQYFEGYKFLPNETKYATYDKDKDELVTKALGFGTGSSYPYLSDVKAVGNDEITVVLLDKNSPNIKTVVTGKVTATGVKFLSCIITEL